MKRYFLTFILVVSLGTFCEKAVSSPGIDFDFRIWGADISLNYSGLHLLPVGDSTLWLHIGGGYEDASFFRNFEGDDKIGLIAHPSESMDFVSYKKLNLQSNLGVSHSITLKNHLLSVFLLYKLRYDRQNPEWSPDSYIFSSTLPDRESLLENAIISGVRMNKISPLSPSLLSFPLTYTAEISLHWAPLWFFNEISDYFRLNFDVRGLLQFLNKRYAHGYIAARIGGDFLSGSYLPVHVRTSVAPINDPFFNSRNALGGTVRGIAAGRFDGTRKVIYNMELRFHFPLTTLFWPCLNIFLDAGLSDYRNMEGKLILSDGLFSAGFAAFVKIQKDIELGYMMSYLINEPDPNWGRKITHGIYFGSHF